MEKKVETNRYCKCVCFVRTLQLLLSWFICCNCVDGSCGSAKNVWLWKIVRTKKYYRYVDWNDVVVLFAESRWSSLLCSVSSALFFSIHHYDCRHRRRCAIKIIFVTENMCRTTDNDYMMIGSSLMNSNNNKKVVTAKMTDSNWVNVAKRQKKKKIYIRDWGRWWASHRFIKWDDERNRKSTQ